MAISIFVGLFDGRLRIKHPTVGNKSADDLLRLAQLGLQRSDLHLETLDNLLGMLGLTRRGFFSVLVRQLQMGYLIYHGIKFGLEIGHFGCSTLESFFLLRYYT